MSSVTFETAAFADVMKKAAKVAPSRGRAFDQASGVVIEFDPASPVPLAIVRATNLDVFSMEWVNVQRWDGEAARWRLPSALLADILGKLPIGTGKEVTLESVPHANGFHVAVKSGRTNAKLYPLDVNDYPQWGAFNPDSMFFAKDMGGRLSQVEWAASSSEPKLNCIYINGEIVAATDKFCMATAPLLIPDLESPVLIPAGLLGQILRETGDIQIGVDENSMQVMPDQYAQIRTVLMRVPDYPNIGAFLNREFDTTIKVNRDEVMEVMQMAMTMATGDRDNEFQMIIGRGELAIFMTNSERGTIGDVLEIPGQAEHARFTIKMTPKNIMTPISKAPGKEILISYNVGIPKTLVKIDSGSGYIAFAAPRSQAQVEAEKKEAESSE